MRAAVCAAVLGVMLCADILGAQQSQTRYWPFVVSPAKDSLEAWWRDDKEIAACVVYTTREPMQVGPGDTAIIIRVVQKAFTAGASQSRIALVLCPPQSQAMIHSHPSGTCIPSTTDERTLRYSGNQFAGILCAPRAYGWYFPTPAKVVRSPSSSSERGAPLDTHAAARRRDIFVTGLALGVYANAMWKLDRDDWRGPRPLVDQWTGYHATAAITLETAGELLGVTPRWRVAAICGAAAGFELSQGVPDPADAAVSCAAAAATAYVRHLVRR